MTKICKNCGCYRVCMFANHSRTEDCDINWQPIITFCGNCEHWDPRLCSTDQGWCPKVVGYRYKDWFCAAGKERVAND